MIVLDVAATEKALRDIGFYDFDQPLQFFRVQDTLQRADSDAVMGCRKVKKSRVR